MNVLPTPGVLSTWGLLDTDIRSTFVRTAGTAARRLAEAGSRVAELDAAHAAGCATLLCVRPGKTARTQMSARTQAARMRRLTAAYTPDRR